MFLTTLLALLTILIPTKQAVPRTLALLFLFVSFLGIIPKKIPDQVKTSPLLSSMISWCFFTFCCILTHTVHVVAFSDPLFFQNLQFRNCFPNKKQPNEREVRSKIARFLDTAAIVSILLIFLFGFGRFLGSAPHLVVY